jgi:hypothetical protein
MAPTTKMPPTTSAMTAATTRVRQRGAAPSKRGHTSQQY